MANPLDELSADLRFAVRSFRRAPMFTAVAFITLVAGIASVTTIFSYMNAVYYAPLPYKDADRIVAIGQTLGFSNPQSKLATVRTIKESARSFERLVVFEESGQTIAAGGGDPQQIRALKVDTSFFPLFALRPQLGRLLAPDDIRNDAPVAVISDALWRSRFGADSGIIGRLLQNPGHVALSVVGVLPPGFRFPYQTDLISPLREPVNVAPDDDYNYSVLAKLKPGVSRVAAAAEVAAIGSRLPKETSRYAERLRMTDEMLDRRAEQFLPVPWLFLGTGLFVLLIACANVANLFLARAADRAREMAVRTSLGATRLRLIRQALTETLLLGAAATAVGTYLSSVLVKVGLLFIPTQGFPSWFHVSVDYRVLAFAAGVTVLVALAVGLMPAREGTRFDVARALKVGGDAGATASAAVRGSKRGLAAQLALAVSLFVSSALLVRSYFNLTKIDFGYPAHRIAVVQPLFDQARYPDFAPRLQLLEDAASRAEGIGGVRATAVRGYFLEMRKPTVKKPGPTERYDGRLIPDGDSTQILRPMPIRSDQLTVSDGYFALLGLALRTGRGFEPGDAPGAEAVTVISEATAKLYWPNASPIGHTIQVGAKGEPLRIVGVVQDTYELYGGRNGFTNAARATLYVSTRQSVSPSPEIIAVGAGDVQTVRSAIVSVVRGMDPNIVLLRTTTMASSLEEAFLVTRVFGGLIGIFSLVALALAMIGIYGVVAFGVSRRTREIGIRIALGGTRADVLRLIIGDASRFVLIGGVIGLGLAVGIGKLLRAFLFGVSAFDPLAYAGVCVLFGAVALVACYLPARRAAGVDPLTALRAE